MAFDDEILKGIRRGAILLVAMLIGVAAYRMFHQPLPEREEGAPEVSVPAQEAPSSFALGPPAVPPPPPLPGPERKVVRKHRARVVPRPVDSVAKVEPAVPATVVIPAEIATATVDEPAEIPAVIPRVEERAAPSLPDDELEPQKNAPHRMRWLKAVGRFLHIVGKNDVPSQALR